MVKKYLSGLFLSVWILLAYHPVLVSAGSTYTPYPGQIEVKLIAVEKPHVIRVRFETWPGFYRDFRVTLPHVRVPDDSPQAPACERMLARRALEVTREQLTGAKHIYIIDMQMEDSAAKDGMAKIITERGDLLELLTSQGLARPANNDNPTPWCQEQ